MKHCINASKRCWWNGKQRRPWSDCFFRCSLDCFFRSSLILVCTVCWDLPVPIHRICTVRRLAVAVQFTKSVRFNWGRTVLVSVHSWKITRLVRAHVSIIFTGMDRNENFLLYGNTEFSLHYDDGHGYFLQPRHVFLGIARYWSSISIQW